MTTRIEHALTSTALFRATRSSSFLSLSASASFFVSCCRYIASLPPGPAGSCPASIVRSSTSASRSVFSRASWACKCNRLNPQLVRREHCRMRLRGKVHRLSSARSQLASALRGMH